MTSEINIFYFNICYLHSILWLQIIIDLFDFVEFLHFSVPKWFLNNNVLSRFTIWNYGSALCAFHPDMRRVASMASIHEGPPSKLYAFDSQWGCLRNIRTEYEFIRKGIVSICMKQIAFQLFGSGWNGTG